MKDVTIREAVIDELKSIQDLNHELFVSDSAYYPSLDLSWPYGAEGEEYFRNTITKDDMCCFVAEHDGKIIGYATAFIQENSAFNAVYCHLDTEIVAEDYRGKGIGAKLAEAVASWGKKRGANKARLDVMASNHRAIAFYERLGFRPITSIMERDL